MATRGEYTKEEEEGIARQRKEFEHLMGWLGDEPTVEMPYPVFERVVTKDLLVKWAIAADYYNPLWRDEKYAKNTRWGGMIAPPFYEYAITHGGGGDASPLPESLGVGYPLYMSRSCFFFKPVRLNDSFKVWWGPRIVGDVTNLDRKSPRTLSYLTHLKYINQKNEVQSTQIEKAIVIFLPESQDGKIPFHSSMPRQPDYRYTKEELEFIDHIYNEEEIRGDKIRYWEDVKINEDLKPIANGPITLWDCMLLLQGLALLRYPHRELQKLTPRRYVVDPITGISYKTIMQHFIDRAAVIDGRPYAILIPHQIDITLGRLITNWMGDDGFLKKYTVHVRTGLRVGDAVIGRGKVVKKYIENGEHVVDLVVWLENMRGNINHFATATVGLLSKENLNEDLLRY